jgi:hypothetical protein
MDRATDRTTWKEDLVTVALASWTILGIFLDAYKHVTDPGLETFWTPWHALFYSGFLATSGWLIVLAWRRIGGSRRLLDAAPRAHKTAIYGVVVFAVGGMGDAVWHTTFGVETSLDALLSPTHLMLWLGALVIASAPLRAAWSDRNYDDAAAWGRFVPVLASLVLTISAVAFFLEYVWVPVNTSLPRIRYIAGVTGEFEAAFGVAGVIITTAVMMAAVLMMARRWALPFGAITVLASVPNVLMAIGFNDDFGALPAIVVAGFAGDLLIRWGASRYVLAAAIPGVLWSGYFMLVGRIGSGLAWPPEVWGGAIVFAILVGLVLEAGFDQAAKLVGKHIPAAS